MSGKESSAMRTGVTGNLKMALGLLPVIFLLMGSTVCRAETGYVSDMLILTMRKGPGSNYNVIRTLRSNTPLEILEKGETHFRVRTEEGDEGWVEKQYVTLETPKPMIIVRLNEKIGALNTTIAGLEKALDRQQSDSGEGAASPPNASPDLEAARQQVAELEDDLETAEMEKKRLLDENRRLIAALQQTKETLGADRDGSEVAALMKENAALKKALDQKTAEAQGNGDAGVLPDTGKGDPLKTGMIKWFLSGAAVLIVGWLLGKSMRSTRKKTGGLLR